MCDDIDILEDYICSLSPDVLELLLTDHSRSRHRVPCGTHIIWATDDYQHLGPAYAFHQPITADLITGGNGRVIMPRVAKDHSVQQGRVRQRAEVFTPSWVCNAQNNLIDDAWFGRQGVFNIEHPDHSWTATTVPVVFPDGRTWLDYVGAARLEMACGEAPYITSRYDTTTGSVIPFSNRIGLLDRKLRVVCEQCDTTRAWLDAAYRALKSIYAYEWQGDSLLIARENILFTFIDAFRHAFGRSPQVRSLRYAAYIVSWNTFQMDGLKFVVPESCHDEDDGILPDLFGSKDGRSIPCRGCSGGGVRAHNGIHAMVRDWHRAKDKQVMPFVDLIEK